MINMLDILSTEKSRVNFIKGLVYISKSEETTQGKNGINPEEMEALKSAMQTLKIPQEEKVNIEKLINSKDIKLDIEFDNMRQSLFFMREAIQVCYAEGCYCQAEKNMIHEMGQILGISEDKIKEIEDWALEGKL
jgi:hypothetical protein